MVKYSKLAWEQENREAFAQAQILSRHQHWWFPWKSPVSEITESLLQFVASLGMQFFWSGTNHSDTLKLVLWRYHTKYNQNSRGIRDIPIMLISVQWKSQFWTDYERIKIFSEKNLISKNKHPNSSSTNSYLSVPISWSEGKGEIIFASHFFQHYEKTSLRHL